MVIWYDVAWGLLYIWEKRRGTGEMENGNIRIIEEPLYSVNDRLLCSRCADHTYGIYECQNRAHLCNISKFPAAIGICPMCEYRENAEKMHDRCGISE